MLVLYKNGLFTYLLAPSLISIGDYIQTSYKVISSFYNGDCLALFNVAIGTFIHNIQVNKNKAMIFVRSAGNYSFLLRKLGRYGLIRLNSKEERFIYLANYVVLGRLSFEFWRLFINYKAGQSRYKGYKSKVRGVAKNAIDHPHGGGSGRAAAGQPSVTPWGIYTKGVRTTTRFYRIKNKVAFFKRRDGLVW